MKINNILAISALFSLALTTTVAQTALAEDGGNLPSTAAPSAQERSARPDFAGNEGPNGPEGHGLQEHERKEMRQKMENMSPEDRKAFFEKKQERFKNMTPEQREALKQKREAWLGSLSPEKRAKIEERMKKRQEMRQKMENMSPEERKAAMEKFREMRKERKSEGRGPDAENGGGNGEGRGPGAENGEGNEGFGKGKFRERFKERQNNAATPATPATPATRGTPAMRATPASPAQ